MAEKYISSNAACRAILNCEMRDCTGCNLYESGIGNDYCFNEALPVANEAVNNLPAVDVAPVRHAHWKVVCRPMKSSKSAICECSNCGNDVWVYDGQRRWNYCPNCGARIDEEGEE